MRRTRHTQGLDQLGPVHAHYEPVWYHQHAKEKRRLRINARAEHSTRRRKVNISLPVIHIRDIDGWEVE